MMRKKEKSSGEGNSDGYSSSNQKSGDKLVNRGESGTLCIFCGVFFDSIVETRKHHFVEHYGYCFEQCSNDMELLQDWMDLREPDKEG